MKCKRDIPSQYEVWISMVTPTRKCDSVFYPSPLTFCEDQNKECSLTKYEQFSVCGFLELSNQHLKI